MAPFWLALDEGFLAREGFLVEGQFVGGSPPIIQGMMSGQYPIGLIGGGDGLLNRLSGGDILLIGTFYGLLALDCYARPEIRSIAELERRTIAITRLATSTYFAAALMLASAGLRPEDVVFLQSGGIPEAVAALMAGQADAAMLGFPTGPQVAQAGYPQLASLVELGDYALFPTNAVAVRESWLRQPGKPQEAVRFLRALDHGLATARNDDAALKRVLRKYTQLDDEAVLQLTVESTRRYFPTSLQVDERGIVNALRLLDHPDAPAANPKQFYDNSLVAEIEQPAGP